MTTTLAPATATLPPSGTAPAQGLPREEPLPHRAVVLPLAALGFIVAGLAAWLLLPGGSPWSARIWLAGLAITGTPVLWTTLRGIFHRRFAADLVAALAIAAALALREPLAGLIVVVMQTGGEALERFAAGRASRAVRALEEAAPRIAHRLVDGRATDIAAEEVLVGDLLLVRPGELVPCDAIVVDGRSHVDTSRLTGEPMPVSAVTGTALLSGSTTLDGAITVRATALARESQYARIVDLVRSAQASKAPLQRLADRYAVWFTPLTLLVCIAAWVVTRDPVRVLAVLVVATPCPLILATPVAMVGGINAAARRQIIVRQGGGLESLGDVRTAVFDKTGTLTVGLPHVHHVRVTPGMERSELLRLAGAVEERSGHLLARTLVEAATMAGIDLPEARDIHEEPGRGVAGVVEGREVLVGARSLVLERHPDSAPAFAALGEDEEGLHAYVAIDGRAAGIVTYADALRPGLSDLFERLHALGIRRTLLLSGDREANARSVAAAVGIDEVQGDLLPEGKVAVVRQLVEEERELVLMVGDGVNDAPALSAATVGIALAGHGGGISTEAADVVALVDDLDRVAEAVHIGRRTMRIARQSIWAGLGLSGLAMLAAAAGYIPPTVGALLQEGIDLAVIANALRAAR